MRFVLRRLDWLVPRTDGAGSVIVTTMERDWRTALDKALAHATRYLLRQWGRNQTQRRVAQQMVSVPR